MRAAIVLALTACLAAAARAEEPLETDDQKTFYALGLAIAQNLDNFDLSPEEGEIVMSGIRDGLTGAEPRASLRDYGPRIDGLAKRRQESRAAEEKAASAGFLASAAEAEGAVVTDSGLVYLETQEGGGAAPSADDTVEVHYHGTLRDGSVFDSSVERGTTARFPLNRVIPCWTEALQKMKVGGKATITCPAAIAYGDRGTGSIPPGAALRFEVELIGIEEGEAE